MFFCVESFKILSVIFNRRKLFQILSYHEDTSGCLGAFHLDAISVLANESKMETIRLLELGTSSSEHKLSSSTDGRLCSLKSVMPCIARITSCQKD